MSVQQKNLAVYNYFSQLQNSSVFLAGVLYNMYIILSLIEIVLEGQKFSLNWLSGRLSYKSMIMQKLGVLSINSYRFYEGVDYFKDK